MNAPFAQRAAHFDALRDGGMLFQAVLNNPEHRDNRFVQGMVNSPHERYLATATDTANFATRANDLATAVISANEGLIEAAHMLRKKAQAMLVEAEINIANVPTVQQYLHHTFRWSPYHQGGRRNSRRTPTPQPGQQSSGHHHARRSRGRRSTRGDTATNPIDLDAPTNDPRDAPPLHISPQPCMTCGETTHGVTTCPDIHAQPPELAGPSRRDDPRVQLHQIEEEEDADGL